MPPCDRVLGQVGVVAAEVDRDLLLCGVQLDDLVDRACEELTVVADDHRAAAQPGDEVLQAGEPVQVEVVGGLVEQHEVEAAQQQGREPGARGLTA